MKIKLSYFLGKRGLTLEKYCRKTSIKSHEELAAHLLENRIECPPASHTRSLFSKLTKALAEGSLGAVFCCMFHGCKRTPANRFYKWLCAGC